MKVQINDTVYFFDCDDTLRTGTVADIFDTMGHGRNQYAKVRLSHSAIPYLNVDLRDCFPDEQSCRAARIPKSYAATNAFSTGLKDLGYKYILRCGDVCWAMKDEPLILTEGTIPAWLHHFGMEGTDPAEINYRYIAPGSYAHI